jgi:hypothetical protein
VGIGLRGHRAYLTTLENRYSGGVLETPWVQIVSTGAFLLVLGVLLVVLVWLPPTFEGIDPERRLASRNRKFSEP